ncbi:unnamed protein product [Ilex paraguariensis]|uniref:non-specific serine/threonine protein kinase n=1 Tax=Ilex paraguariensis TaxID=185542 RepID=A0ABC8SA55_9AQUA
MMNTLPGTSEIVESVEDFDSESRMDETDGHHMVKPGPKGSIEDDINKLFEAIDIRNSRQVAKDALRKSAMKRPIRDCSSPVSGIGISESVSLKQALRGLCISQASEMAAMKRSSKPSRLSGVSEAGTIKRLYRAVVVEASDSSYPLNEGKGNVVISLVPESSMSDLCERVPQSHHVSTVETSNQSACSSTLLADASTGEAKITITLPQDDIVPLPTTVGGEISKTNQGQCGQIISTQSSISTHCSKKLPMLDEVLPASVEVLTESVLQDKEQNFKLHSASYSSGSTAGNKVIKPASSNPRLIKPVFGNKSFVKKKIRQALTSVTSSSNHCNVGADDDSGPSTSTVVCGTPDSAMVNLSEETKKASPASRSANISIEISSTSANFSVGKPDLTSRCCSKTRSVLTKADESSRSREKGEFSQSSKSSIGEYSSSTSFSEESNLSGSSRGGYRPHMSKNLRWEAICCVQSQHKSFGLRHFKLLRKLGGGDIGTVYLAELIGTNCLFALKVMDNDFLASRRKMSRAQTEKEILQMLDHPFLPTLYAHFTTDRFSCLVTEYCPGGDLHVLRQKQPGKSFSEQATRPQPMGSRIRFWVHTAAIFVRIAIRDARLLLGYWPYRL